MSGLTIALPPIERPHKLFVYGTLKEGFGNHNRYLRQAISLGEATIDGIMFHKGGFPAVSLFEKWGKIYGEVYQVSSRELEACDGLENHPIWYRRIEVHIAPWGNVWVYHFPHDLATKENFLVPTGRWEREGNMRFSWLGWDRGIEVGQFDADNSKEELMIGPGQQFKLVRNKVHERYDLYELTNNVKMGHYKSLRDLESDEGGKTLHLPPISANSRPTVAERVKESLEKDGKVTPIVGHQGYVGPYRGPYGGSNYTRYTPPPPPSPEEEDDKEAAKVARKMESAHGLKVRKA